MAPSSWFQQLNHQSDHYRWYALGFTTVGQAAATILAMAFGPLALFLVVAIRQVTEQAVETDTIIPAPKP